jgi:hypothetical protein
MERLDFIQKTVITLLGSDVNMTNDEIFKRACDLADYIYGKQEIKPVTMNQVRFPNPVWKDYELIRLYRALDWYDTEECKKKNARMREIGSNRHYGKSGYSERMGSVAYDAKLITVGDLVYIGSKGFLRLKNVGPKLKKAVSVCLEKLYDIKEW